MWINARTGKGWNDAEESAFETTMAAGKLERMEAIRLYRRMGGDLKKALQYANSQSGDRSKHDAGLMKARAARH